MTEGKNLARKEKREMKGGGGAKILETEACCGRIRGGGGAEGTEREERDLVNGTRRTFRQGEWFGRRP